MIVFSNTTPFIALASIDRLALLPQLFYKVHVAESVIHECAEGGRILVPSLRTLDWVIPVADETASALPFLLELDRGEKQTIVLAQKHGADRVIIGQLGQLGGAIGAIGDRPRFCTLRWRGSAAPFGLSLSKPRQALRQAQGERRT